MVTLFTGSNKHDFVKYWSRYMCAYIFVICICCQVSNGRNKRGNTSKRLYLPNFDHFQHMPGFKTFLKKKIVKKAKSVTVRP